MKSITKSTLVVLLGLLILAGFAVGPYFTTLAVNQVAGREVLAFSFDTWLALFWFGIIAGSLARVRGKQGDD